MSPRKARSQGFRQHRVAIELGHNLERGLRSYTAAAHGVARNWDTTALAVSSAGILGLSVLAPTPLAAEVVYTPTHKVLFRQNAGVSQLILDVNNDGQEDFFLQVGRGSDFSSGRFAIYGNAAAFGVNASNQVMSATSDHQKWDANLRLGANVGPGARLAQPERMASCAVFTNTNFSSGPWRNTTNRYLGLKFVVNGETHYGWARVSLTGNCGQYSMTLTGYAYETVPDQPVLAGLLNYVQSGSPIPTPPARTNPEPASLGALAMGSPGLSIWRRE